MNQIPTKILAFGAAGLTALGLFLIILSVAGWPDPPASAAVVATTPLLHTAPDVLQAGSAARPAAERNAAVAAPAEASVAEPSPTAPAQLAVSLGAGVPDGLRQALAAVELDGATIVTTTAPAAVRFDATAMADGEPAYTVTFAAATRFDTIDTALAWEALRALWSGQPLTATTATTAPVTAASVTAAAPFTRVVVLSDTLPLLNQVLGAPSPVVAGAADISAVVDAAWQDRTTLAIVPFDQLEPRLVVLPIDGQTPVENQSHFNPASYPLVATIYAQRTAGAADEARVDQLLQALPGGNRDPEQLTVLTMTGVTAMCRMMASQMDRFGAAWPAEVVGPELASADITHISNEVPFVEDCVANTDPENFNFCSKPEYMETLTASGVDIIGMTGNHQNDFGRENAVLSLEMYDEWGLPYYGGGKNLDGAFKPLIIEHNGNRLAFLGANSYGPQMAWATDALPGAAPFDLNILSATIRSIKEKDLADLVLVELQYQESYDPQPLADQRLDFNALVRAGADIVTGVQSHVPQGMEFTEGKLVLYGLGNLYFDQMWAQATREGMVVKHTFYKGRHISTQILTTLLYDYGQPRWTSPQERASILDRVFDASYW